MSSPLYKLFKTDDATEQEGVWVEYGTKATGEPIRIRIARAGGGNLKYTRVLERKWKPVRRQAQLGTLDPKLSERLLAEVYAESVILGWENVDDESGNPLPFTVANATKLLTDLPELFTDLQLQANRLALFRADLREADAGN